MRRTRVIFLGSIAVALVVGISTAMASPGPGLLSDSTPTSTATPTATARADAPWTIEGTIQAMNGQFWTVQGFVIRVTADTQIDSSSPLAIGDRIHASGIVQPDGTWLATHVWTDNGRQPTPPASTQTPTPASTGTATVTQTSTPTVTSTITATPTVTITVTPTATRTDTNGIRASDDEDDEDLEIAPPGRGLARGNPHHPAHGRARGNQHVTKDHRDSDSP